MFSLLEEPEGTVEHPPPWANKRQHGCQIFLTCSVCQASVRAAARLISLPMVYSCFCVTAAERNENSRDHLTQDPFNEKEKTANLSVGNSFFKKIIYFIYYLFVCTHVSACRLTYGGQRATFGSWLSPSTLGFRHQTKLVRLVVQAPPTLSHLASPYPR